MVDATLEVLSVKLINSYGSKLTCYGISQLNGTEEDVGELLPYKENAYISCAWTTS